MPQTSTAHQLVVRPLGDPSSAAFSFDINQAAQGLRNLRRQEERAPIDDWWDEVLMEWFKKHLLATGNHVQRQEIALRDAMSFFRQKFVSKSKKMKDQIKREANLLIAFWESKMSSESWGEWQRPFSIVKRRASWVVNVSRASDYLQYTVNTRQGRGGNGTVSTSTLDAVKTALYMMAKWMEEACQAIGSNAYSKIPATERFESSNENALDCLKASRKRVRAQQNEKMPPRIHDGKVDDLFILVPLFKRVVGR